MAPTAILPLNLTAEKLYPEFLGQNFFFHCRTSARLWSLGLNFGNWRWGRTRKAYFHISPSRRRSCWKNQDNSGAHFDLVHHPCIISILRFPLCYSWTISCLKWMGCQSPRWAWMKSFHFSKTIAEAAMSSSSSWQDSSAFQSEIFLLRVGR